MILDINIILGLRNDHKAIMKIIEEKIHDLHTEARARGTVSSGRPLQEKYAEREPYARVSMVTEGSPAKIAVSGIISLSR